MTRGDSFARKLGGLPALRIAIGVAVIGLGALYMRGLDWPMIGRATAEAGIVALALSVVGNLPLIWLKALRMRILLGERVGTWKLAGFYVASYAADNTVMSQAGLPLRIAMLRREDIAIGNAVAVQLLEKLLEGIGLAVLALPLFATSLDVGDGNRLVAAIRWLPVAAAIAIVILVGLTLASKREVRWLRKLAESLAALRDWRLAARVTVLTLAAWAMELAMVYGALVAMHVDVTSIALPILVLVLVNLAALVPGLPANLGSFEVAAVVALRAFGVADEAALAFAIVYHALHTIPVTIVGLAVMPKLAPRGQNAPPVEGLV